MWPNCAGGFADRKEISYGKNTFVLTVRMVYNTSNLRIHTKSESEFFVWFAGDTRSVNQPIIYLNSYDNFEEKNNDLSSNLLTIDLNTHSIGPWNDSTQLSMHASYSG